MSATDATATETGSGGWTEGLRDRLQQLLAFASLIVIFVFFSVASESFFSYGNVTNILFSTVVIGTLALGTTFVIITGGIMGTVMMRYAARMMITLLNKFPHMENTAFVLVGIIGLKLGIEAAQLPGVDFHDKGGPWFWGQWISMIVTIAFGFRKRPAAE